MDEDQKPPAEPGDPARPHPTPRTPPEPVDRRDFLNITWKVLGAALVVEAGWTSYDILNPKASGAFGGEVDAGPVADFLEEGTVKYFLDGRFYVTQYQGRVACAVSEMPAPGLQGRGTANSAGTPPVPVPLPRQ